MYNKPEMTNTGRGLIAAAISGQVIAFTGFKAGNGDPPESIAELTDLVNPLFEFPIKSVDRSATGYVSVTGSFDSTFFDEDFRFKELGLFAEAAMDAFFDGDGSTKVFEAPFAFTAAVYATMDGSVPVQIESYDSEAGTVTLAEVPSEGTANVRIFFTTGNPSLYAYVNDGDNAGMLSGTETAAVTEQSINLVIAIGSAPRVTVVVAASELYASKEEFNAHVADDGNPHSVTAEQVGLGNLNNIETSVYPVSLTNPQSDPGEIVPIANPYTSTPQLNTVLGAVYHNSTVFANDLKTNIVTPHVENTNNPHQVTPAKIGAATSSHNHAAADITSGRLSLARGGTGVGTVAALLELLGIGGARINASFTNGEATVNVSGVTSGAAVVAMRSRSSGSPGWFISACYVPSNGKVYLMASDATINTNAYVYIIYKNVVASGEISG